MENLEEIEYINSVREQYFAAPEMFDYDGIRKFQLSLIEKVYRGEKTSVDAIKTFAISILYQNPYFKVENAPMLNFISEDDRSDHIGSCNYRENTINLYEGQIKAIANGGKDALERLMLIVMGIGHESCHMDQYRRAEAIYSGRDENPVYNLAAQKILYDLQARNYNGLNDADQYVDFYRFIKPYLSSETQEKIKEFEKKQSASIESKLRTAMVATYENLAHEKDARIKGIEFGTKMFKAWADDPYASETVVKACKEVYGEYMDEYIKAEYVPNEGTKVYTWFERIVEENVKDIPLSAIGEWEDQNVTEMKNSASRDERTARRDMTQAVIEHCMKIIYKERPVEDFELCLDYAVSQNKTFMLNSILGVMKARGTIDEEFKTKSQKSMIWLLSSGYFPADKWSQDYEPVVDILSIEQALSMSLERISNGDFETAKTMLMALLKSKRYRNGSEDQELDRVIKKIYAELLKELEFITNRMYAKVMLEISPSIENIQHLFSIIQFYSNILGKLGYDTQTFTDMQQKLLKAANKFNEDMQLKEQGQPH